MLKNKESVIGWILIALLMFGWMYYQGQKAQEEAKNNPKQSTKTQTAAKPAGSAPVALADSASTTTETDQAPATKDSARAASQYGAFAAAATGEEKTFVIENEVQKITLTSKGGLIKSIELKDYKTWDKKPMILFTDKTNTLTYQIPVSYESAVSTKDLYFEPVGSGFNIKGTDSASISFRLMAGDGKYFEQKYTLKGNEYLFGYDIAFVGLNGVIPQNFNAINAEWQSTLSSLEKNLEIERRYSALYYRENNGDVLHLDEDNESDKGSFDKEIDWISFKQQFFNTTLFSNGKITKAGTVKSDFKKDDTGYVKKYVANFNIPYSSAANTAYHFEYFVGPNHYYTLSALDRNVEDIIKLGPNFWMFSWIKYITHVIIWVFSWFENLHLNYGIIILLLTLMLKVALHPLTAKSIESAAKMKILAPELTALREKYGEDQARMGQEQMKLYTRAGVSPLGGCLPLLLQFPILMAMYYFFPASIELRQEAFLWATDLSSYDSVLNWATPILGQTHLSLFTILMTASSVVQAVMNNQMNAMGNQQPGMKYIPYVMPFMLMFMFNGFPAALTYYYLLQNLLGVGHQWITQKFLIDENKLRAQIEEHKKNPKPKSGWQKKLEDMQRQNEARAKQKK
jgi:YidC/Oxa1 family membrane protein insertase